MSTEICEPDDTTHPMSKYEDSQVGAVSSGSKQLLCNF